MAFEIKLHVEPISPEVNVNYLQSRNVASATVRALTGEHLNVPATLFSLLRGSSVKVAIKIFEPSTSWHYRLLQ